MKHRVVSLLAVLSFLILLISQRESAYFGWAALLILFAYMFTTALGSSQIAFNYFFDSLLKGDSADLHLTFDDGPDPVHTPLVLDMLSQYGIKATFFLIGSKAAQYPELVRRIDAEGHLIGNHTFSHSKWLGFFPEAMLESDIRKCSKELEKILGKRVNYFRPPFGVTNPRYGRILRKLGMTSIGWSLRSLDTQSSDATQLQRRITTKVRPGDIILLHDTQPVTIEMLPSMLKFLTENGFRFGRMSDSVNSYPYSHVS